MRAGHAVQVVTGRVVDEDMCAGHLGKNALPVNTVASRAMQFRQKGSQAPVLYGRMHIKADCQRNDASDAAYNNDELRSDNHTRLAWRWPVMGVRIINPRHCPAPPWSGWLGTQFRPDALQMQ